jgi:hypothetical protein
MLFQRAHLERFSGDSFAIKTAKREGSRAPNCNHECLYNVMGLYVCIKRGISFYISIYIYVYFTISPGNHLPRKSLQYPALCSAVEHSGSKSNL